MPEHKEIERMTSQARNMRAGRDKYPPRNLVNTFCVPCSVCGFVFVLEMPCGWTRKKCLILCTNKWGIATIWSRFSLLPANSWNFMHENAAMLEYHQQYLIMRLWREHTRETSGHIQWAPNTCIALVHQAARAQIKKHCEKSDCAPKTRRCPLCCAASVYAVCGSNYLLLS